MSCGCHPTRITNFSEDNGACGISSMPIIYPDPNCCCGCHCHMTGTAIANAEAYAVSAQSVGCGGELSFTDFKVNAPCKSIAENGSKGFVFKKGTYLVTFMADATPSGGKTGAQLTKNKTGAANAETVITTDDETRLALTAIFTTAEGDTVGVKNPTDKTVAYANAVLTAIRLG